MNKPRAHKTLDMYLDAKLELTGLQEKCTIAQEALDAANRELSDKERELTGLWKSLQDDMEGE